jgi:ABC-type Fe3+/spermidine/putrescine transport system ATPase subunit
MSETTGLPLHLAGVTKRYGTMTALNPTDLDIGAGEFLTLLGPSGSGKTTLLNLVAGYTEPSGGVIRIGTQDVTQVPARHRNIGMVFQSYALFPHMTVFQNLAYGLEARKLPRAQITARVEAVLALMQLEGFGDRPVQRMSGGQQQRVAVARALVIEPDVLLMDEPLGALDRQLRRQVQVELRRLHLKHGRTTIYVTHDQEEALVLSDRIAVMGKGRIQQLGTAAELYARPANSFIAGFVGESNLMEARVLQVSGGVAQADVPALGRTVTAPAVDGVTPGMPARLMIRPEHVRLSPAGDGIAATVTEAIYLGELTQYGLSLPGGTFVVARLMGAHALMSGTQVQFSWAPDEALIVPQADL